MSEQLRHKMINFEVVPPSAAWEAITARLDDDKQYAAVATKMNNFNDPPPPQIWNKITVALEEKKEANIRVINIRRTVYRATSAAVIIGLFIGGWIFINKNTVKIDLAKNNNAAHPAIKEGNTITAGNTPANQKEETVAAPDLPVQNNTKNRYSLPAASGDNKDHTIKYAVVNRLPAYHEGPIIISSSPIPDKAGAVIRDMDVLTPNSNYLLVTGPDGQLTRISAKFANVIRYLNGSNDDPEEYLDKVIKENDTWKKRFQEWRNKISQSSFLPSSANLPHWWWYALPTLIMADMLVMIPCCHLFTRQECSFYNIMGIQR